MALWQQCAAGKQLSDHATLEPQLAATQTTKESPVVVWVDSLSELGYFLGFRYYAQVSPLWILCLGPQRTGTEESYGPTVGPAVIMLSLNVIK